MLNQVVEYCEGIATNRANKALKDANTYTQDYTNDAIKGSEDKLSKLYQPKGDYILSKDVSSVGKTGLYSDLKDTPTIPVVDDTVTSDSTNAVSSKAVAEAIAAFNIPIKDSCMYWTMGGGYIEDPVYFKISPSHYNILDRYHEYTEDVRLESLDKGLAWYIADLDCTKAAHNIIWPDTLKWKDSIVPVFEDGGRYLITIVNGLAEYRSFGVAKFWTFYISGGASYETKCRTPQGLTWAEWMNRSKYRPYLRYKINENTDGQYSLSWDGDYLRPSFNKNLHLDGVTPNEVIIGDKSYTFVEDE